MNNEEKKNIKPSKNFFIFYCVILFLFAGILITFSYLSNAKVEQQLVDTTQSFTSRLEQANTKIAEFDTIIGEQKKQITTLTTQVTEANDKIAKQDKQIAAAENMWRLEKAYYRSKYAECRAIIATIDENGLREFLSADALKELKRIEKLTKGA